MDGTRGLLRASDGTRKREVVDVPMEGTTEGCRKRESMRNRARCEDDEGLSEMKSREIGEDRIVERKVVAERRFGRKCSELPLEGMETKSESTKKKRARCEDDEGRRK